MNERKSVIMRPKNSYTKEEYDLVKKERDNAIVKLKYAMDELREEKISNSILMKIINKKDDNEIRETIRSVIEEERNKYYLKDMIRKHPYYKDIENFLDMGVTNKNLIAEKLGKSYSAVYRAVELFEKVKGKRKDLGKMRLNI